MGYISMLTLLLDILRSQVCLPRFFLFLGVFLGRFVSTVTRYVSCVVCASHSHTQGHESLGGGRAKGFFLLFCFAPPFSLVACCPTSMATLLYTIVTLSRRSLVRRLLEIVWLFFE
jgi:hypothetical protein